MPISRKELIRRLVLLGFTGPQPGGKHAVMRRRGIRVTIPNPHGNQEIDDSLLSRILQQAGISKEEFSSVR